MSALLTRANTIDFKYAAIEEAFPTVDPGHTRLGSLVMVQIRQPKRKTSGGIHLPDDVRSTDHYNTQVAKVIALGPIAFKNRDSMTPWPEGAWCQVGDFVRVPKYQGERISVPFETIEYEEDEKGRKHKKTVKEEAVFALFKDLAILAKITSDPLRIRAFLDG